jgi:hypothetical protein
MSFNDQLFLVIPRHSLKQNLQRFCFKPHTDDISPLYIKPEEDKNHFRYGENLLDFVNSEGHLNHQEDKFIANITVGFQNTQHNEARELYLIYREEQQYLFNPKLDLAVLWIDARHGLPELLFSKTYRPIFNSLIDQLEVVWGFNRDYPNAGPYPYEYKDEVWLKSPVREFLNVWASELLIIGKPLVNILGLDNLNNIHTFATWKTREAQTFIFVSPFLYYLWPDLHNDSRYFGEGDLGISDDYLKIKQNQIDLEEKHTKALNDTLHLPMSFSYTG